MRRGITLLIFVFVLLIAAQNKMNFVQSKEQYIPKEAIRLRIIANSNDESDQELKIKVRDEVLNIITDQVKDVNTIEEARTIIYNNLDKIDEGVAKVLADNNVESDYYVNYGITKFPEKVYNKVLYPAGKYEAIYIVLGEGKGENWWCVLFPPLCLVDVAVDDNGETTVSEDTKVHYSFLIVEKIRELLGYK